MTPYTVCTAAPAPTTTTIGPGGPHRGRRQSAPAVRQPVLPAGPQGHADVQVGAARRQGHRAARQRRPPRSARATTGCHDRARAPLHGRSGWPRCPPGPGRERLRHVRDRGRFGCPTKYAAPVEALHAWMARDVRAAVADEEPRGGPSPARSRGGDRAACVGKRPSSRRTCDWARRAVAGYIRAVSASTASTACRRQKMNHSSAAPAASSRLHEVRRRAARDPAASPGRRSLVTEACSSSAPRRTAASSQRPLVDNVVAKGYC